MRNPSLAIAALIALAPVAAPAQGLSGLGGGTGGLLGGLLPNVASTGGGNAAGVLGYCVKNQLLGSGTGATSALDALKSRAGLTATPGYAQGREGTLVTGRGQAFSLDGVKGKVKAKVCDMVLQHAKSLL